MTTLSETQFEEKFRPHMRPDENYFEWEDVKDKDVHLVWTVVETGDCDNESWYALPGFHIVNKIGYLLAEVPWVDGEEPGEAVWFEADMALHYENADADHKVVFDVAEPDRCGECGHLTRANGTKHGVPDPDEGKVVVVRETGHGINHGTHPALRR
jgi:hypothetical protein